MGNMAWIWRCAAYGLLLAWAGLSAAAKTPPAASEPVESPALRDLLERPIGADPASQFHLSAALATLGHARQAAALRRFLLQGYLRQAAGEAPAPALSVRQAIVAAADQLPVEQDARALERWTLAVNRGLALVWPQAPVVLPPELEASRKQLREIGPGLWSDHQADGSTRGYMWWSIWRHGAALALPLGEFRLYGTSRESSHLVFNCELPRYARANVPAAGADTAYLCRASSTIGPEHPAYADLVRRFTGQAPVALRIESQDLKSATAVEALVLRLEKLAKPQTESLLARHTDCVSRGDCTPPKAPAAPGATAPSWWAGIAPKLHVAGSVLGLLLAYAFLVRLIGRGGAAAVGVVLGWIGMAQWVMQDVPGPLFERGTDAGAMAGFFASFIVIGVAAIVPVVAVSLLSVVHELVFGDRARTLRDMGRAVVSALAEGLVDVLMGRRRRR